MFDGLKDKLGRFRDSTAEEVDQAEESDADPDSERAADADAEDVTVDRDPDPDPDSAASSAADSAADDADDGPSLTQRAKAFATGGVIIRPDHLDGPLEDLEFDLLSSDVAMPVADQITTTIREELEGTTRAQVQSTGYVVQQALREALLDVISVGQFDFDERVAAADKPVTIVFTGVNGVGKTTTIAKLARYFERRGLSTVLANGDTYRAGANEQLAEHARRLDKRLISHEQGGDPAAVIYDAVEYAEANDVDVVLGDTAGRLHTSNDLMAQLEKIDRVVSPDMTLFVDEATAGQDAVKRAEEFNEAAPIDGVVLTKVDADSDGGAAISIAHVTGRPILFLGVGQEYDDLERFDPERIVNRLVPEDEDEPGRAAAA